MGRVFTLPFCFQIIEIFFCDFIIFLYYCSMISSNIDNNILITETLQSHYNFGFISIGYCDRMMMVKILPNCTKILGDEVVDYLTKNRFIQHENTNVFCRFKSRSGEYISIEEFDKENYGIRKEMVSRLIGKEKQYV